MRQSESGNNHKTSPRCDLNSETEPLNLMSTLFRANSSWNFLPGNTCGKWARVSGIKQ